MVDTQRVCPPYFFCINYQFSVCLIQKKVVSLRVIYFGDFGGGLLYFSGCFEGRVKVACSMLYPIFKLGRGLLYFLDYF